VNAWDVSASLVRLVVVAVVSLSVLLLRKWVGGRLKSYLTVIGGMLFLAGAEALHLVHLSAKGDLHAASIAWESVYVHGAGYLIVSLGFFLWLRDFHAARLELEQNNLHLKEAAATDFLTALINRRHIQMHLDRELARAKRSGAPLGFIMIDLDHFKRINDTYGHEAGDAVLMHVGKVLKGRTRASDVVARYGGEEFLVVAPGADLPSTVRLAEALRGLLESQPTPHAGRLIPVRASLGVALFDPAHDGDAQDVLARADKALYTAKARGRNRVVAWPVENAPAGAAKPVGAGLAAADQRN
jgi:diguanylate cyclase (GGDEF)-like protein